MITQIKNFKYIIFTVDIILAQNDISLNHKKFVFLGADPGILLSTPFGQ